MKAVAAVPASGSKGFRVSIEGNERVIVDKATGERLSRPLDKSPIERMYRPNGRGAITREQLEAGLRFAEAFELAGLLAKPAMVQELVGVASGRRAREPINGRIDAQDEVAAALRHVGLLGGLVLEWVVGQGFDIAEFVARMRWNGRAIDARYASGMLQVALSTLVAFYEGRRPLADDAV